VFRTGETKYNVDTIDLHTTIQIQRCFNVVHCLTEHVSLSYAHTHIHTHILDFRWFRCLSPQMILSSCLLSSHTFLPDISASDLREKEIVIVLVNYFNMNSKLGCTVQDSTQHDITVQNMFVFVVFQHSFLDITMEWLLLIIQ